MIARQHPSTDSEASREAVEQAFPTTYHDNIRSFFEYGRWKIMCLTCGAIWSAHHEDGRIRFEKECEGDEYCDQD